MAFVAWLYVAYAAIVGHQRVLPASIASTWSCKLLSAVSESQLKWSGNRKTVA